MPRSALIGALLLWTGVARAQEVALPEPVAEPTSRSDPRGEAEIVLDVDREIDLTNVVTSAAKGVTTVQEAPAIITIITADEIKARGLRGVQDVLATVPGWIPSFGLGNQADNPAVRGVNQAFLLMHDGLSLFDPYNEATTGRVQPIENIKRFEVVTGPGGVLWGANSFLGIVNLITKDAEDVNGLELSAGYGDGPGNKQDFKTYALFGKTFFGGKLKLFQHVSYESFIGTVFDMPQFLVSAPSPQPSGLAYFAANAPHDPPRSWFVIVDGKYSLGPVSLYYMVPFGDYHPNLTFANTVNSNSQFNNFERYGVLEYKDRYAKDRVGLTVKGYGIQFVRDFRTQLFPPSGLLPANPMLKANDYGGLLFDFADGKLFRVGGSADLDVRLPYEIRLLGGGEFFYEGVRDSNERFPDPADPNQLPIVCPVDASGTRLPGCPRGFLYDTGRYQLAGYLDVQWRPFSKLALDGGVRIQKAFGDLPYNVVPLGSAAIVYHFLPGYHLKLNYASGFRAPVLLDTSAVSGGVSFGANPKLRTESSQSFQGELNARLLHNVRKVRELEVRADYSYTILSNIILLRQGNYANTGRRAIHSAEGYAKLYLAGDHFLQASYTYLYSVTTDSGVVRGMPNHWFVVGGSFNLVKRLLDVNVNLAIYGAYEDPNRVPTGVAGSVGGSYFVGTTTSNSSDLALDRLTPVANLQLGFRLRFLNDRLQVSGQVYNVLNQHYYYPDPFYDLTPTLEITPNPAQGISFLTTISFHL